MRKFEDGNIPTGQQWKENKEKKEAVSKKVDRAFIISTVLIAFIIYFFFTASTLIMIDVYHRSTLKRVVRVEKKLDAANKQIKWLRQALGVTVKGKVRDGSRLDKLDRILDK